jgi:hypothetical protein
MSIYIEKAYFEFTPQRGKADPLLVAHFSRWGDYKGAEKFVKALGNARKQQVNLSGEQETHLDMEKMNFHDVGKYHSITFKGEQNIGVLVNWAAKREDKGFINKLRRQNVLGAEGAYISHLPPDERAKLYPPAPKPAPYGPELYFTNAYTDMPVAPPKEYQADVHVEPPPVDPPLNKVAADGTQLRFPGEGFEAPKAQIESATTPQPPAAPPIEKERPKSHADAVQLRFTGDPAFGPGTLYTEKLGNRSGGERGV